MSSTPVGCFSWLCGGKPKKPKPTRTIKKGESRQVVPSVGQYAFEASKQTIEILQQFGDALPIPCANQVLQVGLLLLTTYEDVTAVQQQVKELNNRIGSLLLIMIDQLNGKDEKNISPEIINDIEKLGTDLETIQQDLAQIAAQNRLLLIFFKNANQSAIEACLDRLKDSLQTFQVARAIEDGNMLFEIQNRLKESDKIIKNAAEKIDKMYDWLKPKDGHNAQGPVLEEMPAIPPLHGRDEVIKDVADFIATNSSPRVGILGAGGMGKTSVAVSAMNSDAIAQKYDATHRFWVPCMGVASPLGFVQILRKSLRVTKDTGSPLKDLLDALTSSNEPRLLLLDNLETAMSVPEVVTDGGPLSSEEVLNRLASIPHVGIIVTIRSNQLPSQHVDWRLFPLSGVARDDARTIFTDICPEAKNDPSLDPLLEVLGYMPYAVTLMSKQAVALAGIDLKDLLDEWKKNGPNALSDDLRLKMNRSIELSIKSRAMEDPDSRQLLAILSKLPFGTSQHNLKWWAGSVKRLLGSIATLNNIALITQRREGTTPKFFVLPVVQSYLREDPFYNSANFRGLVLEACCKFVLDHKSSPSDQDFKAHLDALAFEQVNIQTILLTVTAEGLSELKVTISTVFEAMLAFSWFQYYTKRSDELVKHMLEIAHSVAVEEHPDTANYVAEAHFCLGRMYFQLSRYSDSCEELEIAHAQFRTLGNSIRAGDSTLGQFDAYFALQSPEDKMFELVQEAQAELENDPAGSARALVALGICHWYTSEPNKGMEVLINARDRLEELGCSKDVVDCMYVMNRCYLSLGELEDCRKTCEAALKLSKQVGLIDAISDASYRFAVCQIRLQHYEEALELLKENLTIEEALGNPMAIAQRRKLIGYVLAMKREYAGARIAYEGAKKEFSRGEETDQTRKSIATCDHNLRQLDQIEAGEAGVTLRAPELE